jgi:serine protease Do
VNIVSTKMVKDDPGSALLDNPLLRHFFGDDLGVTGRSDSHAGPGSKRAQSLGSGVICTPDGYILTDYHVVEDAEDIKVTLADDHTEFTAKVVGSDPQSDVAVLKINANNLPPITMGNSDELQIGDVVLAIGNPFGVGQTVTMGIASAVGRGGFSSDSIEDFIQTDASINPGNSGGALIDSQGRLIGLNAAILSRSGGNQGIGFAVPINLARNVMEHILQTGRVVRGYLGVYTQPLTPELAKAFNLPPEQTGALIGGVAPGSPAARAGFHEGDVIAEYNGKNVTDSRQLRVMIAESSPSARADLKVLRNGQEQDLQATLGELPQPKPKPTASASQQAGGNSNQGALDKVEIKDLDGQLRQALEIPSTIQGALVTKVDPGSTTYQEGLRPGDVIIEINHQSVGGAEQAIRISQRSRGNQALLRVWSKDGVHYVAVESVGGTN